MSEANQSESAGYDPVIVERLRCIRGHALAELGMAHALLLKGDCRRLHHPIKELYDYMSMLDRVISDMKEHNKQLTRPR